MSNLTSSMFSLNFAMHNLVCSSLCVTPCKRQRGATEPTVHGVSSARWPAHAHLQLSNEPAYASRDIDWAALKQSAGGSGGWLFSQGHAPPAPSHIPRRVLLQPYSLHRDIATLQGLRELLIAISFFYLCEAASPDRIVRAQPYNDTSSETVYTHQ